MRESRYRQRLESFNNMDLTPLLDMVFILLIFFIVSASFIREPGVEVERPSAMTAQVQPVQLVIAVDADNRLWIEGRVVDIRLIGTRVRDLVMGQPDLGVVVAADVRASAGVLVEVLDLCRQAGAGEVSVATRKPQ